MRKKVAAAKDWSLSKNGWRYWLEAYLYPILGAESSSSFFRDCRDVFIAISKRTGRSAISTIYTIQGIRGQSGVFNLALREKNIQFKLCLITSHSAYVATSTELQGVKIDGILYPNFIFHYWGATVEELFAYIFWIYIKFGYKNQPILTPSDSVDGAT